MMKVGSPFSVLAMAALHYREANFRKRVKIEGGPFQLDLGGSGREHQRRIDQYVEKLKVRYKVQVPLGPIDTDFKTAALVAAHVLRRKTRSAEKARGSVLADAFWGYNGRSKYHTPTGEPSQALKSWRHSPYVVNDPKNGVQKRIRGTIPDGKGGRRRIDRIDPRPGALIVYRELEKLKPQLIG